MSETLAYLPIGEECILYVRILQLIIMFLCASVRIGRS